MFDCLAGRPPDVGDLSPADWQELLALSRAHSVQPLLAHRLLASRVELPESVKAEFRQIERDTASRNMGHYRDFAAATRALAGLPVIALKGMQLMAQVYDSLAVRSMLDLDLLVRVADLDAAADALQGMRYEPMRPYRVSAGPIPFTSHHLPPFRAAGATSIELHWHIVPPQSSGIDVDELWDRSQPARIAGVDTRVLAAEDLLLHLCVHATYSHRCVISARACCDIAAVVRRFAISWSDVVERATRWQVAAGTYLALRLARELLGASVPDAALSALEPADFDESLLPAAIRDPHAHDVSESVVRLRSQRGMLRKLAILRERLFVPPDALADQYNVERSSLRVYPLYAVRAKELAKKYWRSVAAPESAEKLRKGAAEVEALEAMLGVRSK